MKYFINLRDQCYLNHSLCYYGILVQNHTTNIISETKDLTTPYMVVTEGIICDPYVNIEINNEDNIVVVKNNKVVIEKRTNNGTVKVLSDGIIFDLYDEKDHAEFDTICSFWEQEEKIYAFNTEIIPKINHTISVAGLSSGIGLAKMAHEANAEIVVFFDYKQKSLDFQKELIYSDNRKEVFIKHLQFLTCGKSDATLDDIDSLDFNEIDTLYAELREKKLKFIKADLRSTEEITNLINELPEQTTLWISNVFHYVTTINVYKQHCYDHIESLCKQKNIDILPYTKIDYES